LIKKVLKKVKGLIKVILPAKVVEDNYYKNLFVKNDKWNKAIPNNDELRRWESIEAFIKEIGLSQEPLILDLGSGRGWLSNLLSKYGDVIGIDPVKDVVNYARELFPNIKFLKGTTKNILPHYSGKFDLIVSSEVFEHIEDSKKEAFVKDVFNLLKPNGTVIITTPRKEVFNEWAQVTGVKQPVEDWFSEQQIEDMFKKKGGKNPKLKRIPVQFNEQTVIEIYQVWLFKKDEK
jgi:2-polyprenyl-3-methyl-5-hydroxy-6-metoxy-1,4-benzoquinol methylase